MKKTKQLIVGALILLVSSTVIAAVIYRSHHVTGTGGKPATAEWYPTSTNFGNNVMVGESLSVALRLKNSGKENLTGIIRLASDCPPVFSITNGGGPYTLLPGQSKVITLQFAPIDSVTYECDILCTP